MKFFCAMLAVLTFSAACGQKEGHVRLDVTVQPEGAQVSVDGVVRGTAPCSIFDISPGCHLVHVSAPSCRAADAFVELSPGDYVQKNFSLVAEKGLVLVKTDPPGADVKKDGVSLGTTPLLLTSLSSDQTHSLELALNGYRPKRIDVHPEGRTPLVCSEVLSLDSGIVTCTSEPPGATVTINGVERGVTPLEVSNVPKGLASITFRLAGYKDETRELRLAPGERQTLALKMKGRSARLVVVSTPEHARVFLDRDYQGKTPTTISSVEPGTHELTVELPGHAPVKRTVQLGNGDDRTEEFRLETVQGRMEVVTTPPGAKVSLDGKAVGTTRSQGGNAERSHVFAVENITAGEHSLLIRLDGYRDVSRRVVVKSRDTAKVYVKLSRIFTPDTEVETIRGVYRGVLVSNDPFAGITLEVSPGVRQTYPHGDIRKINTLK